MNGRTNVTTGTNADILEVPLDSVTKFVAEEGTGKVLLSWTDPKDKYATPEGEMAQDPQQLVSVWSHTVIVRKEGSDPVDENDGVVIVSSSVRNQYVSTQYTDANVSNGIEYHYGAFAINEDGIASDGVYSSAIPRVYDTVLANNTWAQIDEACSLGIAESFWEIGDEHTITITRNENPVEYTVVILDFNHDTLSDLSSTAVITFGLKNLLNETHSASTNKLIYSEDGYNWFISNDIYNAMDMKDVIAPVRKDAGSIMASGFWTNNSRDIEWFVCNAFLFSEKEVTNTSNVSRGEGVLYPYFSTSINRIKAMNNGTGDANHWSLRSGVIFQLYNGYNWNSTMWYSAVNKNGSVVNSVGTPVDSDRADTHGVCFGFCIGKSTV